MEIASFLRRVPGLRDVPDRELARFASVAFSRHLRARELLFQEGEQPAGFYVVESGWVKTFRSSSAGREILLDVLGPLDAIGSCCGQVAGGPHGCSASSLTNARVVWVRGPTWQSVVRECRTLREVVTDMLFRARRRCVELAVDLALLDVDSRLARLLIRLSQRDGTATGGAGTEISGVLSQQEMAAAIGTAREVVSRHLKKLLERGVLSKQGRRMTVLRPDLLAALADGKPIKSAGR
ncbi:MAG: Crp/Fnr family transcriptional regulator [Candidatus Wallbacteria bacterium]|nr:Crp/Fnr family transcriptional regulator [Candidatus Wallbacteria bacterium]